MHPQRDVLLDALMAQREVVKPLQTVLRTNLVYPLTPALLERLSCSTDQVVVSVDGDEASHDARRGAGSYAHTVANLRELLAVNLSTRVGITAVLPPEQMRGPQGDGVRALGKELGVRVRFKSVLPLGRGAEMDLSPAFYSSLNDSADAVVYGARIASTCGLGMNLYVGPEGGCYPCYALMGRDHYLGNALEDGLPAVLERNNVYRDIIVDSNEKCHMCALRYVCGGFCRAWGIGDDANGPPVDCSALYQRATGLVMDALEALAVSAEDWMAAGLPQLAAAAAQARFQGFAEECSND